MNKTYKHLISPFLVTFFLCLFILPTKISGQFFHMMWETTTPNESITIPTFPGETYNYTVFWDTNGTSGSVSSNQTGNSTHIYPNPGLHLVRISGVFPRIYFNNSPGDNKLKIKTIERWGSNQWTSMQGAFHGCANLDFESGQFPDTLILSNLTDMSSMFKGCENLDPSNLSNIQDWDVSNVVNMASIFEGAAQFNGPISDWDVSNVTDMSSMFKGAGSFNRSLSNWDVSNVTNMSSMFEDAVSFTSSLISWNVDNVTDMSYMFKNAENFAGPISKLTFPTIIWNTSNVNNMKSMFHGAESFNQSINEWDVSNVTNMSSMFHGATSFNKLLDSWNVQNVTDMSSMFQDATFYNQEMTFWNVSNVSNMSNMFKNAEFFRQDLTLWDVENVTNMESMFHGARFFDHDIKNWDVGNVTNMVSMFKQTERFNQDIGGWDVRNVVNMAGMFSESVLFNQYIGDWDVSSVTDMSLMFGGATLFNQDIGNWDVSNVANMSLMFLETKEFNTSIQAWDVSNVSNMALMFFDAFKFNQNLGNWNISNVTNMSLMFGNVASLSTENYDAILLGWNDQNVQNGIQFSGGFSIYCEAEGARSQLINNHGWTIDDLGICSDFVSIWETTNPNESITIPTTGTGYNYHVDWGDGTLDTNLSGDATHTYTTSGFHVIKITGEFPRIYFNESGDKDKIIFIKSWGDINWTSMENAFRGCSNLSVYASDTPNLSQVTSMSNMFEKCHFINESISNWDVSNVQIMDSLFYYMSSFNQPIGSWDVSNVVNMKSTFHGNTNLSLTSTFNQSLENWDVRNVTDMSSMFRNVKVFNQDISNWDTRNVTDMSSMFQEAIAFDQDISNWDTRNVTDMSSMFQRATEFNQDIGNWDVSNVINMESLFEQAISFNQNLENWDVSKVTNMTSLFELALTFNHPIGNWNVSNVTSMQRMFSQADAFNQDIGAWDVSNVINMQSMLGAEVFNQDIGSWDVSNVTNMASLFGGASSFNQNIGNWDVSNVVNMSGMFSGTSAFNQDIGAWNVSNVTDMSGMFVGTSLFNQNISTWDVSHVNNMVGMFYAALAFDQNIGNWDVSQVNNMAVMFYEALAFDQNIGNWDVGQVTDMSFMFDQSVLSTENYDSLLIGWEAQNLQQNVTFSALNIQYCEAENERNNIINNNNWTITDAGLCGAPPPPSPDGVDTTAFITTWQLNDNLEQITIPTEGPGYNYNIDWGDGSFSFNQTGNATHVYLNAGTYTIKITGTFPRIRFVNGVNASKIVTINQWGTGVWTSMERAFSSCRNLHLIATDVPDLSQVTDMSLMFFEASYNLGGFAEAKMAEWDVSNVQNMRAMFYVFDYSFSDNTSSFNPQIGNWDVSNVTDMSEMFFNLVEFDQDLSGWDVSNVIDMEGIFTDARAFNQDISGWNVSNVEIMSKMFRQASSFNQDISSWDVSNVTSMFFMFVDATSFDQNLSAWDVSGVTTMKGMFDHTNLSTANYDSILIGWEAMNLQSNVEFGAKDILYCDGAAARANLISNDIWVIDDGGSCDNFKTTWKITSPFDKSITIPTIGGGYNYTVSWGDGETTTGHTGNITYEYEEIGIKRIIISGDFPRIYFKDAKDEKKIISIDNWGSGAWTSMNGAFTGCANLEGNAVDIPNLTNVSDMSEMFEDAKLFNQDISDWNTSNITNMSSMFKEALSFDQDISSWQFGNVTNMASMFEGISMSTENYDSLLVALANGPIQNGVTFDAGGSIFCESEVERTNLFNNNSWTIMDSGIDSTCIQGDFVTTWAVTSFFESITIPTTGSGYDYYVHWGDGQITSGHTGDATHQYIVPGIYTVRISGNFPRIHFNDAGDKDKLLSVTQWGDTQWSSMESAFKGCSNLELNASDTPDLSLVTDMSEMFAGCLSLNQDIGNWNISNVVDLSGMFNSASLFNQDLSTWQTGQVTHMNEVFAFASAFNQDISSWDVSSATEMAGLFMSATAFNQNIGTWDVSNAITIESLFENATSFNQDISNWSVDSVQIMNAVFSGAINFNQDLASWNVSNVDSMANMFANAESFNQNLSAWNIENVKDMANMFENLTLSTANYDSILISWATQNIQSNVTFSGGNSIYCNSSNSRDSLINLHSWNISDGGNCTDFITTWETNSKIKIPTEGSGYNYTVDWGDGTITTGHTGDTQHTYSSSGIKRIKITGDFPRIYFNDSGHKDRILEINNWGNNPWTSMNGAFYGCLNLVVLAEDQPDLTQVTDMFAMFAGASSLNQDIGNWDVSNITNMLGLFSEATNFNQDISSWNVSNVTDMSYMFADATSFNQDIGNWNVSNTTTIEGMFLNAENFDQDVGSWNVANVTAMAGAFENAYSFDQDLGDWNVANVADMDGMFAGVTLSTANYDSLLIGWSNLTLQNNVHFTGGNSVYCAGESAKTMIINDNNWTITDGGKCDEFITTWETTNSPQSILVPVDLGETYNYTVDWGDGTVESGFIGHAFHVYLNAGTYRVKITGDFPRILFNNSGSKDLIIEVNNWGDGQWTSMENAFYGCNNLTGQASDTPDLSMATSTAGMFRGATSFNQQIGDWDVSTITDMTLMFEGASTFNQPIGDWDVSSVSQMFAMLNGATSFDQNLANWNIEQVTNMSGSLSFTNLSTANYDSLLISWNGQNVQSGLNLNGGHNYCDGAIARSELIANKGWTITDDGIDFSCTTNQFISTWETTAANETITIPTSGSGYDYTVDWGDGHTTTGHNGPANHTYLTPSSYVIRISGDFPRIFFNNHGDKDKIKSIDQWGIEEWSRMNNAFYGCSNLVVNATDLPNLTNVDDMSSMFEGASSFNKDISDWDVSNVTDMKDMFASSTSFDQNLGNWDITNVTEMDRMFENSTLSTSNYDSLLIGWNAQDLQQGVTFDGGNSKYCLSIAERFKMINEDSWTITDADQDPNCTNCNLIVYTTADNIGGSLRYAIDCATSGDSIVFWNYVFGDSIRLASNEIMIDKEISMVVPDTINIWLDKVTSGLGLKIEPSGDLMIEGLQLIANPSITSSFINNQGVLILKDVQIVGPNNVTNQPALKNSGNLIIKGTTQFKFLE